MTPLSERGVTTADSAGQDTEPVYPPPISPALFAQLTAAFTRIEQAEGYGAVNLIFDGGRPRAIEVTIWTRAASEGLLERLGTMAEQAQAEGNGRVGLVVREGKLYRLEVTTTEIVGISQRLPKCERAVADV